MCGVYGCGKFGSSVLLLHSRHTCEVVVACLEVGGGWLVGGSYSLCLII